MILDELDTITHDRAIEALWASALAGRDALIVGRPVRLAEELLAHTRAVWRSHGAPRNLRATKTAIELRPRGRILARAASPTIEGMDAGVIVLVKPHMWIASFERIAPILDRIALRQSAQVVALRYTVPPRP